MGLRGGAIIRTRAAARGRRARRSARAGPRVCCRAVKTSRPRARALAVAVVVGAAVACGAALAGCGGDSGPPRATLVLDFTPNAVHAGIYSAVARGFDRARGVAITIREPSSSTDSVKLLLSGRADFAVLDIHDLP